MKFKKRLLVGHIKKVKENGSITGAVASTPTEDRDDEILSPDGWELENFKKAPRLLWSHSHRELPIGKVTNIVVDQKGNLVFDATFAEKENDFAKKVADLMRGGFLNTFSVGFIPKERKDNVFLKQELLEISVVNVPANPEARLASAYKSFMKDLDKMDKKKNIKKKKIKKIKKKKEDIKEMPEKNRLLIRTSIEVMEATIPALRELLKNTKPTPKGMKPARKKAVKVGSREADQRVTLLKALRLLDKTLELSIKEIKDEKEKD